MLLSAIETRPGYKELLRELIRSQIGHLVEQLSRTGEESFVVSAAGDDEVPHLIGSTKGLDYMKGFTGVQEGFLHYLQKNASTSGSEKRQTLITHIDSKQAGSVLPCVSESLRCYPDATPTSKPNYSVQIETLKEESLVVIDACGKQPERSIQDVVQGQPEVDVATSKPIQVESLKKETDRSVEDVVQEQAAVDAAISETEQVETLKKETDRVIGNIDACGKQSERAVDVVQEQHVVDTATCQPFRVESLMIETDRIINSDDACRKMLESPIYNVAQEQPVVEAATINTHETPLHEINSNKQGATLAVKNVSKEKADVLTDKTAGSERDFRSAITSTETSDGTKTHDEVFYATVLSAEAMDSDDEESDLDLDDSDFDEMEEEEIFPQLINDLNQLKESFPEKMDISNENYVDENNVQNTKNTNTEHVKRKSPDGLKVKSSEKTVAANLSTKIIETRTEISPVNENDIDEVKVIVCGRMKPKQVYKFRNNLFSLTDTIQPKDLLCKYCKKDCRTVKELKEHEGSHSKIFCCYKCDKDLESLTKLRDHNTKCVEVPQSVKEYFKSNPDCSPKRHWTGGKNMKRNCTTGKQMKPVVKNNPPLNLGTSYKELLEWEIVDNKCPFPKCGRQYLYFYQVKEHLVVHTKERPFKCPSCKKTFRWRRDLTQHEKISHGRKHIRQRHRSSKAFKATSTSTTNPVKNSQKDQLVRDASLNTLKTTTQQNSGRLRPNFKTPCKTVKHKTLNKYSDARIRKYKCPYCEKRYFTNSHLEEHVVKHTGVKNFKCSSCDQKFLLKSQFPGHKKKCDLENPGRVSPRLIKLNRKQRPRKTQNKQIITTKKTLRSMSEVEKALETARQCKGIEHSSMVRCNVCGLELKTMKSLRHHILSKHFMELYLCSCGERFHTAAHQYLHMKRTGCKFVKESSGTQGGNAVKSISNEESHKEKSSNDSGTEANGNAVHNTEPRENVAKFAEHSGKEYLPQCLSTRTSSSVHYICSICNAKFSSAYEIVEHNNKTHGSRT